MKKIKVAIITGDLLEAYDCEYLVYKIDEQGIFDILNEVKEYLGYSEKGGKFSIKTDFWTEKRFNKIEIIN